MPNLPLWINPIVSAPQGWMLDKSGQQVSPLDVVLSGNRHMHAVSTVFSYRDEKNTFVFGTVDAPLIALGEKSPLNVSRSQPDLSGGINLNFAVRA